MSGRPVRGFWVGSVAGSLAGALLGASLGVAATAFKRSRARRAPEHAIETDGDYPRGHVRVDEVDGTHMGLAVAILRDRVARHESHFGPESDDSAVVGPVSVHRTDGIEDWVTANYDYHEIARSSLEASIVLAYSIGDALARSEGDIPEDLDVEVTPLSERPAVYRIVSDAAVRVLHDMSHDFERAHLHHAAECDWCASADMDAPGRMRARLFRDLAEDLSTRPDEASVVFHGTSLNALFDVAYSLLATSAGILGIEPVDQVDVLLESVALTQAQEAGDAP